MAYINRPTTIVLKWSGTLLAITAALLIALNTPYNGLAFIVFAVSAICWVAAGWLMREMSLVLLNLVLFMIDLLGIYRWLLAG
jgi:hypothetical protein